jgi:peptidoglycan/LPS O-acetylase OafA/YrhL
VATTSGPRDEIRPLVGVRAFAAAWVLVFHAGHLGLWDAFPSAAATRVIPQAGGSGYLGVDLFFLLSGFILTWTYAASFERVTFRGWSRYVGIRLARIYPVHVAVLLVLGGVVAGGAAGWWVSPWGGDGFGGREFLLHLALVHSWGFGAWLSWNQPAWSISAEWLAYLVFPFLCAPLTRLRSVVVLLLAALAALAFVALVAPLFAPGVNLNAPHLTGLVRVAGEFVAGCCLCRAFVALAGRGVPWGALSVIAAGGVAALAATGRADPWALPLFGLLVIALAASRGPVAAWLASPVVVLGGRISYATYLVHWPLLELLGHAPPADAPLAARLTWSAAAFVGPVLVAWAAWRWIEEPGRRTIRRGVEARLGAR